jgi:hypothetical protein
MPVPVPMPMPMPMMPRNQANNSNVGFIRFRLRDQCAPSSPVAELGPALAEVLR